MSNKPTIYLETTIPSYLAAKPSNNLTNLYRQYLTRKWWDTMQDNFTIYTSIYTWRECSAGDSDAAQRRLDVLGSIQQIPITDEAETLAREYINLLSLQEKNKVDAFHLSICVINQIDYLLSWNCAHLGAASSNIIAIYNHQHGLFAPILATPEIFFDKGGIINGL